VKYAEEETVLPDDAVDLFVEVVDSWVSKGGGWPWPVRCACWIEPVRFSLSDGDPV
jgi:hypothetical protein